MSTQSVSRTARAHTSRDRASLWDTIADHRRAALIAILVAFVVAHLARINRVLINADGENYLRNALVFTNGHLPHSRYSPGWGALLTPIAAIGKTNFHQMYVLSSLLNLVFSVAALYLLHRFLSRYLAEPMPLIVVALFALGQTATEVLFGAEVEPLALLLVCATLVALQEERVWLAIVPTAIASQVRIAILPFFFVLWLLQLRRYWWPTIVALGGVGLGVIGYLVTAAGAKDGYVSISTTAYKTDSGVSGVVSSVWKIVPPALLQYTRDAIPAMIWPNKLLDTPPGWIVGLLTFALIALGAWRLVWNNDDVDSADRPLVRAAVIAGVITLGLFVAWPANAGAKIRLTTPLAPMILLATVFGVSWVLQRVDWKHALPTLGVIALAVAVVATSSLVVRDHGSDAGVDAFVSANQKVRDLLPPGPVLSRRATLTEVITGHPGTDYDIKAAPDAAFAIADRVGACAIILDTLVNEGARRDNPLRQWYQAHLPPLIASSGDTFVFRVDSPRCH